MFHINTEYSSPPEKSGNSREGFEMATEAEQTAYEMLMRAKEQYRAEAHRLARELADAKDALRPFAALAEVCDHFKLVPGRQICSWRIAGKRDYGPTADDCRKARAVYGPPLEALHPTPDFSAVEATAVSR